MPNVLVCMRCEDSPSPVVGSIKRKCSKCDKEVYVSKASLDAAESGNEGYDLFCIWCVEIPKDASILPPSKKQIEEIVITELKDKNFN